MGAAWFFSTAGSGFSLLSEPVSRQPKPVKALRDLLEAVRTVPEDMHG